MSIYEPCHLIIKSESQYKGNLWLGDYESARNKRNLRNRKIIAVITAGLGMKISYHPKQVANHKILALYDCQSENIKRYFDDAFEFLQKVLQQGNVLVHCFAGVSRSATIVISYLMRKNNISYKDAHLYVKKRRPYVNPNKGFIKQLKNYQQKLNSQISNEQMTKSSQLQQKQQFMKDKNIKNTTFCGSVNKTSQTMQKNDRKMLYRGLSYRKQTTQKAKLTFSQISNLSQIRPFKSPLSKNSSNFKQLLSRSVINA